MAIIFVLLAASFAAIVNFCLRKDLEFQKTAQGYLALYFIFSFIVSLIFRMELNLNSFSPTMGSIGVGAGLLSLLMMVLMARALQIGPSGLTFAFQNSASMLPALALFFLFGMDFGFNLKWTLIAGFGCVLLGLFLSLRKATSSPKTSVNSSSFGKWIFLVLAIFFIQGTILFVFQWSSLFLQYPEKSHFLLPWSFSAAECKWFMPGFFLVPAVVQSLRFYFSERRTFSSKEWLLGTTAGVFNAGSTFCLLMATQVAHMRFRPILFPLFAVVVILLCSLWGKWFYQERIEWMGLALCLIGVFIGSL